MSKTCTVCKKENAKSCLGCQDTPVLPFDFHNPHSTTSTYYCSTSCQKTHWKHHRKTCTTHSARRAFIRAGSTLQHIYYIYREKMFDKYIVKVEHGDGKLYLYEGDYREPLSFDEACVFPFPEELCKGSRKDKEAILATLGCADSMVAMHQLMDLFLSEMAHLTELTLMIKDAPRESIIYTRLLSPPDCIPPHGLTRVKLTSGLGEVYALDLASAQHGWYDPVVEWDEYAKRVHVVEETARFGATMRMQQSVIKNKPDYRFPLEFGVQGAECLRKATVEWLENEGLDVGGFLGLKQDLFTAKQKDLLEFLQMVMEAQFATLDYKQMRKFVSMVRGC